MSDPDQITVTLSREEARALSREAEGQSILAHVQLQEEVESFWAVIDNKLRAALDNPQPSDIGRYEEALTPEEARELFSLWLCHGMRPPEIDERHPAYTGAMKLGAAQPHPEDEDLGRPLGLPTGEKHGN